VLDEPTNDLDLETLDMLQEMIADYPGTVLLVSHDRDFLDRTVTSVLMAEGDGRFTEYAGGYSDMVAQRGTGVQPKERNERVPPAKTTAAPTRREAKRRLSYNEVHALRTLPAQIANAEHEVMELQRTLADPGLYARDPTIFAALTEKLAAAQKDLSAMEDRWIELEMLRDEIAGDG
jgi:ATP-binding cassette subfamily F protein uup